MLAQQAKIQRLSTMEGWDVRRVDATVVFASMAEGLGKEAWESVVWEPSEEMVNRFLETPALMIHDAVATQLPTDLELEEEMAWTFIDRDLVLALPAVHEDEDFMEFIPDRDVVLALPAVHGDEDFMEFVPDRDVVLALPAVHDDEDFMEFVPDRDVVLALPAVHEDEEIDNGPASVINGTDVVEGKEPAGGEVDGDGGNAGVAEAALDAAGAVSGSGTV